VLASFFPSAKAHAQNASTQEPDAEPEMETITVTGTLSSFGATKSNVPIVETARSISVETSQQFSDKGALNLSQTTSYLSGVTAETYGFATRGDWIHARGLDLPRYRDSIQELFGSYNTTRADIYTIEQVEVLRGPASVLYGQGSPGGIVNYVSKIPRAEATRELVAEIGNFDRRELALDLSGPLPGADSLRYRFVGLYRDSDTQVDYVNDDTSILMPSLTFAPTDDTSFTVIGLYQDTDSDTGAQFIPIEGTLLPLEDGTFIDQDVYAGEPGFNRFNTQSSQITFLAEHSFNEALSLEATALWRDGEADYHQAWPIFLGPGDSRYLNSLLGMEIATPTTIPRTFYQADNTFEQSAVDLRLRADIAAGNVLNELLVGLQYQDVETDNNTAYFYGGGVLSNDLSFVLDLADPIYGNVPDQSIFDDIYVDSPTQSVQDLGLYVSDQVSIEDWRLTAGLRYDKVDNDDGTTDQSDDEVSVSAAALYRFDNGFSPYLSYSESFETVVGTDLDGNQLEPEEARQYELGFKYEPEGVSGLFTLSLFDLEISNLPNPNSLPGDAAQQQGVSTLSGMEFEARANVGDFYFQGGIAFLDAEDPNGFELAGEPDSLASLWVSWRPGGRLEGIRAGAGVRHVGKSASEDGVIRYETPDYTLADVMLGYELADGWDFALNVRNIADKKYLTSCLTRGDCFPGMRRFVNGNVTFSF
jgi:iron complex outermembrane receptor protein